MEYIISKEDFYIVIRYSNGYTIKIGCTLCGSIGCRNGFDMFIKFRYPDNDYILISDFNINIKIDTSLVNYKYIDTITGLTNIFMNHSINSVDKDNIKKYAGPLLDLFECYTKSGNLDSVSHLLCHSNTKSAK
jgi:hypothetical protein